MDWYIYDSEELEMHSMHFWPNVIEIESILKWLAPTSHTCSQHVPVTFTPH